MSINYKEYPSNWKTEIRPLVLKRANNCCEFCLAPNHQLIYRPIKGKQDWKLAPLEHELDDGIKITKIILTIAHLDHDKLNHNICIDRLRALCQRCHLGYDLKNHINNRKYGKNFKKNQTKLF